MAELLYLVGVVELVCVGAVRVQMQRAVFTRDIRSLGADRGIASRCALFGIRYLPVVLAVVVGVAVVVKEVLFCCCYAWLGAVD